MIVMEREEKIVLCVGGKVAKSAAIVTDLEESSALIVGDQDMTLGVITVTDATAQDTKSAITVTDEDTSNVHGALAKGGKYVLLVMELEKFNVTTATDMEK